MRRVLLAGLLLGCPGPAPSDSADPVGFSYPLDDVLRVHHLQAKGTHNSYHQAPEHDVIDEWNYSHAPLQDQLACQGVRQLELDFTWDEQGGFEVVHVPLLDPGTSCDSLRECLGQLWDWSEGNPAHHPIFVMLEPKDRVREDEAEDYLRQLEAALLESWPQQRLLTPDLVRGSWTDLPTALSQEGWPLLGDVRGRMLLWLLDSGVVRDAYTHGGQHLDGRLMFVRSDPGEPYAAVLMRDDPLGSLESIQDAVRQGYLVRTRADSGGAEARAGDDSRLQAALESGATMISTDFPGPEEGVDYLVRMPGGTPSRCNPLTAPAECASEDLEDPVYMDHRRCWPLD